MGVKRIGKFNLALLCKWKWWILDQLGALWYGVLKVRYGDINLGMVHEGAKGNREDLLSLESVKPLGFFNSNCKVEVGSGRTTSFWHSNWTRRGLSKSYFLVYITLLVCRRPQLRLWADVMTVFGLGEISIFRQQHWTVCKFKPR